MKISLLYNGNCCVKPRKRKKRRKNRRGEQSWEKYENQVDSVFMANQMAPFPGPAPRISGIDIPVDLNQK